MDKLLEDIKNLKIQGASNIAISGLLYIKKIIERSGSKNRKEFEIELMKKIDELRNVRPTEPALFNVLASVLTELERMKTSDADTIKKYILRLCDGKIKEIKSMVEMVSKIASKEIKNGDTIMTHCHSNTVVSAFKRAKYDGKNFRVIVTETRPLFQGLKTAKDLLKIGVETIYCVDSAIGYMMKEVNKVFVGCDAILYDGSIVNKIGTFPIAIVAKQFVKPFYVIGETIKITEKIELEHRSPKEIVDPKKLPGAKILNPAFDITPSEFITAIITEKGKINPKIIRTLI